MPASERLGRPMAGHMSRRYMNRSRSPKKIQRHYHVDPTRTHPPPWGIPPYHALRSARQHSLQTPHFPAPDSPRSPHTTCPSAFPRSMDWPRLRHPCCPRTRDKHPDHGGLHTVRTGLLSTSNRHARVDGNVMACLTTPHPSAAPCRPDGG